MKIFVLYYYLFVLPSSPNLIFYLFLLSWCLLYCAYYYSLSTSYLYHLILFLLFNYHLSSSFLSLMSSPLSFCSSQSSLFSHLFPMSWLRTHLSFVHSFGSFSNFFSLFLDRFLLIRISWWFLDIFPLKLINIVVQRFHSIYLWHGFVLTFLQLNFGLEFFIFDNLSLSYIHVNSPFF